MDIFLLNHLVTPYVSLAHSESEREAHQRGPGKDSHHLQWLFHVLTTLVPLYLALAAVLFYSRDFLASSFNIL